MEHSFTHFDLTLQVWRTEAHEPVPDAIWTPFAAKLNVPNIGWGGVFTIAAIFDICAALIAFFILRRMSIPSGGEEPAAMETPRVSRGAITSMRPS